MRYSVITINYNNCKGLRQTIDSVLGQSYKDFEYIIIDGGSSDGSVEILNEYDDKIHFWVSEPDNGIYNAMNKGVVQAHGEYCIFMNSGDCFHSPDALNAVEQYQEDIVCGQVSSFPSGHHKPTISLVDLLRISLPHQAMFIKRELLIKHPYDEQYKILSDWKFCLETLIIDNCSFRTIENTIADYESGGISTYSNGLLPKERELILKELFPPRILADYQRLVPVDDELLDQALLLTKTSGIRKLVKGLTKIILFLANKKK
jgi:glycosyltransferase involved in cell wall biosynthesis